MPRSTGTYREAVVGGETIRALVPDPLPPREPPLHLDSRLAQLHAESVASLERLSIVAATVRSAEWFLYGFVRKEAVISSQIEGTQATLQDVVAYEVTRQAERPADVKEVCNYVEALKFARAEIARSKGLPLCTRLLCEAHKRLTKGVRGAEKQPGMIRTSQNWIGGTRPGDARFVPPPPEVLPEALAALETWIYGNDPLRTLKSRSHDRPLVKRCAPVAPPAAARRSDADRHNITDKPSAPLCGPSIAPSTAD
jgi:Fic family protein